MKSFLLQLRFSVGFTGLITLTGFSVQAAAPEQECKSCRMTITSFMPLRVSVSRMRMQSQIRQ